MPSSDSETSSKRVDEVVNSRGIKLHIFKPSGRKLWVVVGKDNEHWTDPDLEFCTCKHFYFRTLSTGKPCYHLQSVRKAISTNNFVTVEFDDSEYRQILDALVEDAVIAAFLPSQMKI